MNKKINFSWYGFFLLLFVIISVIIMTILYLYVENKIFFAIYIFIFIYLINCLLSLWMINSKKRTNYSKMTWILAFCLLPIISLLLYILWGRNPFKEHSKNSYFQENKSDLSIIDYSDTIYYIQKKIKNEQMHNFMYLLQYNYNLYLEPVYLNNSILPIFENEKFLEIVVQYIKKAKKIIFIQEYIISSGFYLNIVMNELIKKANEGIKIYIIYDRVGSFKKFNKKDFLKLIQNPNIQIMEFESDKDFRFTSTTNYRNHKKMILIDNEYLISGGSNIGEEYINQKQNFVNWKDFNFILTGPIIQRYFISFSRDWINNSRYPFIFYLKDYLNTKSWRKFIAKFLFIFSLKSKKIFYKSINTNRKKNDVFLEYKNLFKTKLLPCSFDYTNNEIPILDCNIVFSNTGPRFFNNSLTEQIIASILNAKNNIKIITPYFYINESIINALNTASRLGVKIDIILPRQKDKWFLLIMNRSNYEKILNFENTCIYEYDGFIHTKAMIIDDNLLLLGSYNLDLRSLSSNFENILIIYNNELIGKMNEYFERLLINTYCVNYLNKEKLNKHFFDRFISFLLKIIHPLL